MVIHDRSYARWKGDRRAPVEAVSVMLQAGIRRGVTTLFRRKIPAVLLILAAFGPFVFGLGFLFLRYFVLSNAAKFGELAEALGSAEVAEVASASPDTVWMYLFQMQAAFVLVACVLLGAGLVAEDRRSNALELYLSRPLSVRQYLLGKFATIAFFIALVTVAPASILVLAQLSLSWGQEGEGLRLLGLLARTVAAGAVWVVVPSLVVLTASSLTEKARNAAILFLAFVFVLEFIASNILVEIFGNESFRLLQVGFNVQQVGAWLLGSVANQNAVVPVWQSVVVLLGWAALCVTTMLRRVRPVEVVS